MSFGTEVGTIIGSLSFEVGGETSNSNQPTVLSCGGIFCPKSKIPTSLRSWHQMINLPGNEISAKLFGLEIPDSETILKSILQKEVSN